MVCEEIPKLTVTIDGLNCGTMDKADTLTHTYMESLHLELIGLYLA